MFNDKDILIISIVTIITSLIWVIISSLTVYLKTSYTDVSYEISLPIESEINFEGIF